jgi:general secretion pathway protein C
LVISRAELDRALSDFAALSKQVAVARRARGGFRVQRLAPGSFFERLGLHAGDVVLRIDGRPLNAVEDASAAYAWIRVTDHFSVDLLRGGRSLTLRYHITS